MNGIDLFGQPLKLTRRERRARGIKHVWNIPSWARKQPCVGPNCSAMIYLIESRSGRPFPLNIDGTSHWGSCPDTAMLKKKPT